MGLFDIFKKIKCIESRHFTPSSQMSQVKLSSHEGSFSAPSDVSNDHVSALQDKNGKACSAYRTDFECCPNDMVIDIEGDYEEKPVYTYVGSALKGIRKGDYFYADVVKGPLKLVSELNGAVWQVEPNCTALAYKGQPFGSFSFSSKTLIRFIDLGCAVRIKCRHDGWYEKPIPEIVMQLPNMGQLWDWSDACQGLGHVIPFEETYSPEAEAAAELIHQHRRAENAVGRPLKKWADKITIRREDDAWGGPRPAEAANVTAEICLLPTPTGSKAKPHILVSVNGVPALEVTARSGATYKKLKQRLNDEVCSARVVKLDQPNMQPSWCLTLIYEGVNISSSKG